MKRLIHLRRQEEAFRSLYFHFPNTYEKQRCVEYIKLDRENRKIKVLLNCDEEPVKTEETGEILFARNFQDGVLGKNGTLIFRMK